MEQVHEVVKDMVGHVAILEILVWVYIESERVPMDADKEKERELNDQLEVDE